MILLRRLVARSNASRIDSLDPVRGVHAHLGRDLLRGAGAHHAAIAAVEAFGSLADDDEVDVFAGDHLSGEWGRYAGIEPARPEIHVVLEREAQLQQQPAFQQSAGHVGRAGSGADGTEQDHVGIGELIQNRVRQHLAGPLPAAGSEVVAGRCEDARSRRRHRAP